MNIEVNDTPSYEDDYITWAPTFSRIKIEGLPESMETVNISIENDNGSTTNPNSGGDLNFAEFVSPWPSHTTASNNTTSVELLSNNWVKFVIAGKPSNPSENDKDAVFEVKLNGENFQRHEVMVRVRKNANNLTNMERDRYISAIHGLNRIGSYIYNEIHSIAVYEAHNLPGMTFSGQVRSAFLPWHRAFILDYERELQNIVVQPPINQTIFQKLIKKY
ncbi:MAG: tyrosinase [Patiriisocius sp.]|jgi:tyrosinase